MQDESFADRVKLTQNFFQAGSFSVFGGAAETAETSSEPSKSKRAGSERHPEVPAAKDIQPQTLGKSSVQSFSDQNVDLEDQMNLLETCGKIINRHGKLTIKFHLLGEGRGLHGTEALYSWFSPSSPGFDSRTFPRIFLLVLLRFIDATA